MSRQNVLVQIDVFKEQKNQFFKLQNQEVNAEIVPLAAFYLAIDKYYQLSDSNNIKNKSNSLEKAGQVSQLYIKKGKKLRKKEKFEKLLDLRHKLIELQEEGYSLRNIKKYLKGAHGFDVSHTYIADRIKEFEGGT